MQVYHKCLRLIFHCVCSQGGFRNRDGDGDGESGGRRFGGGTLYCPWLCWRAVI